MTEWRKSSRSGGGNVGGQECVELARLTNGVGLRDSKAPEAGHLIISAEGFAALLKRMKRDEYGPSA